MNKLEKSLLALAITCTLALAFVLIFKNSNVAYGSVGIGNSYHSTSTRAFNGTSMANGQLLQLGSGDLGSVVITGAGTGTINIYDATSTVTQARTGTTTLASFPASTAAGTYQFDSQFYNGLVIEFVGASATSTITFR